MEFDKLWKLICDTLDNSDFDYQGELYHKDSSLDENGEWHTEYLPTGYLPDLVYYVGNYLDYDYEEISELSDYVQWDLYEETYRMYPNSIIKNYLYFARVKDFLLNLID